MSKTNEHPYNEFLRKHYCYKQSSEEEIRTQIYKNKETNDFTSMVTILKSVSFKTKAEVEPTVIDGNIFLKVTIKYFEDIPSEEITALKNNLRNQLSKDNIIITAEDIPEDTFTNMRVIEL